MMNPCIGIGVFGALAVEFRDRVKKRRELTMIRIIIYSLKIIVR